VGGAVATAPIVLANGRLLAPEGLNRLRGIVFNIPKELRAAIPRREDCTPEKVKAAHAAGLQVVPWTSNTPAEWDKLISTRVDAIISDDPAALIAYLKEKKLR
jgi:glycerophosphoryl diester phosphodiesterase